MSAQAVPHISLEQARQLVSFLEEGEQASANQLLLEITSEEQTELFSEVGKLTRQLHESLKSFELDTRIADLTTDAIPDAKQRLNHVMEMTEQAANKTMDAVEESLPIADKLNEDIGYLKPGWNKLMSRDLKVGEFKALCHELNEFIQSAQNNAGSLHTLLNEILMAQEYQDLTGQIIRRVIELVREVEDSLIHLLTVFGTPEGVSKTDASSADELMMQQMVEGQVGEKGLDETAEGPILDAETRDDVVSGQDEVDDLLSSLGF